MKCFFFWFHNWSKWTKPYQGYNGDYKQYSECEKCGKIKQCSAPFQYAGSLMPEVANKELDSLVCLIRRKEENSLEEYQKSKLHPNLQNKTTKELIEMGLLSATTIYDLSTVEGREQKVVDNIHPDLKQRKKS